MLKVAIACSRKNLFPATFAPPASVAAPSNRQDQRAEKGFSKSLTLGKNLETF
jgi:hypothetical protein